MKMPKPRRLFSWLVLAGMLVFFGFWVFSPHEAKYEGKPVSYWFKEYCRASPGMNFNSSRRREAVAALKELGTNAVPYLVKESFKFRKSSPAWSNFCKFLDRLPPAYKGPRPVPSELMCDEAPFVLKEMKPPAPMLLSLLKKHLKSTNPMEHGQCLFILGTAGDGAEQAVPYLSAALNETNVHMRQLALQSLSWIGPQAKAAVPALMQVIERNQNSDTNHLARTAAIVLGRIGPNAAPAVPLVAKCFEQGTNSNAGYLLAAALFRIDPTQTNALNLLIDGVQHHRPANQGWSLVRELGEIGPTAKAAVPVLLEALESTNDSMLSAVPRALTNMGVAPEAFLPIMKKRLNSAVATTRANAASRIMDIAPADHEAHLVLMNIIQTGSPWVQFAIDTLGDAGPAAAEALPVLHQAAENNPRVREAALSAIRRIEAKPKEKR